MYDQYKQTGEADDPNEETATLKKYKVLQKENQRLKIKNEI